MVNLCVTTTTRQDLLPRMLRSAFEGSVRPDFVYIIDQARDSAALLSARDVLEHVGAKHSVVWLPIEKQGCESSAINWYLQNVAEERVIAHDDCVFGPTSLEQFVNTPGANLADTSLGVITYRDECVKRVGLYDEAISPNFYRYNDVDYMHRCALADIWPVMVDCGIVHTPGGTMQKQDDADYWRRVEIARQNYVAKWGRMPERDPRTGQWM